MTPDTEKLKRYPRALRVAWVLIILNAMSAIVNLSGSRTLCEFTGKLFTNPPSKILPFYLAEVVGYNVFTLMGMALALFEWKRNKNPDGRKVFMLSLWVFFGIALTY